MSTQFEHDISLKPVIYGFSLEKLNALCGCEDASLSAVLTQAIKDSDEDLNQSPEVVDESCQIIARAIEHGIPLPGLVSESDPHVMAAATLAKFNQDLTETGSQIWEISSFWMLAEQFGQELEPGPQRLLNYFCEGRPLFGRTIEANWGYYGYLSFAEVKELKQELIELEGHIADWEDAGTMNFLRDLIEWLRIIVDAEQDLWFDVQ
jgi:hypothetical protein